MNTPVDRLVASSLRSACPNSVQAWPTVLFVHEPTDSASSLPPRRGRDHSVGRRLVPGLCPVQVDHGEGVRLSRRRGEAAGHPSSRPAELGRQGKPQSADHFAAVYVSTIAEF